MNKEHETWLLQQLADLDATKARLAEEVKNKKEFERDWLAACDELCNTRSRLAKAGVLLADAQVAYVARGMELRDAEARLAEVEARHQRVMAVIRLFCAKYTPDLLAEFDAVVTDSAAHRENDSHE